MVHTKNPSPAHKPPTATRKTCVLKRRKSSAIVKPPVVTAIYNKSPTKLLPKSPRTSPRKLLNPFRKNPTPAKKARLEHVSPRKATLRSAEKRIIDSPKSTRNSEAVAKSTKNLYESLKSNSVPQLDFASLQSICNSATVNLKAKKTLDFTAPKKELVEIPVDLRPGYKLRITSSKPFPWMKEARAKASSQVFIKNEDIVAGGAILNGGDLGEKNMLSDIRTFYLFAHNSTIIFTKYTNLNTTDTVNGDETLWAAHGKPKHRVIITPTTSGLKQILLDEDIKFELPLSGRSLSRRVSKDTSSFAVNDTSAVGFDLSSKKHDNGVENGSKMNGKITKNQTPIKDASKTIKLFESPADDGDEDNDNADDHDEWLKNIGISPRSTLGFGRHKTISDFTVYSTLSNLSPNDASQGPFDASSANDATRSTAVITEPKSIQAFYNFLCSTKDFRSNTGAQAGLPPTIIASCPFKHGAVNNLDIASQIVKRSRSTAHEYIIEVENGPILPHMPSMLVSFLESIPELSTKDNEIKVMVSGRNAYSGINECIDFDAYFNHSEFSYKPSTGSFFV
uniref:Uncharacterized protein n=1 Tax=Panagrolaimus sp. ES5 TaxID=591445 RepID=A0AC34F675_9BILA